MRVVQAPGTARNRFRVRMRKPDLHHPMVWQEPPRRPGHPIYAAQIRWKELRILAIAGRIQLSAKTLADLLRPPAAANVQSARRSA